MLDTLKGKTISHIVENVNYHKGNDDKMEIHFTDGSVLTIESESYDYGDKSCLNTSIS